MITRHFVRSERATKAVCGSASTLITMSESETTCPICLRQIGRMPEKAEKPPRKRKKGGEK